MCSDERGEATEEGEERATGVHCERAAPGSSTPEGAEETEASSRTPDERPEALPPLSLDLSRVGGEEAPREAAQGASRGSPFSTRPSEGREEEEEGAAGCVTSEEVPARKTSAQGEEKSLKGEQIFYALRKSISSQRLPTAPETNPYKRHRSGLWYKSYLYT